MFIGDLFIQDSFVRMVHLSMLALCFLLVVTADLTAAKSTFKPLSKSDFRRLHRSHAALTGCLLMLWLSGLALAGISTGLEASQASPKLIAKFIVVTILSVNAIAIGLYALPFYERNAGKLFGEFEAKMRVRLATCAAVSSASWISALCLGAIPALKTAGPSELVGLLGSIYMVSITLGALIAVFTVKHRPLETPMQTTQIIFGSSRAMSQINALPRSA